MTGKVRRVCDHFIVLGLVGSLVVAERSHAVAQAPTLTVRPREMAMGTRTARAGWQTPDGEPLLPRDLGPYWRREQPEGDPQLRELWSPLTYVVQGGDPAFFRAHPDELAALEATGMWGTP